MIVPLRGLYEGGTRRRPTHWPALHRTYVPSTRHTTLDSRPQLPVVSMHAHMYVLGSDGTADGVQVQAAMHSARARAMSNPPCTLRVRAPCPTHDYIAPPMTTSPPRTAPDDMSLLMESGTTDAVMGNSTGAVLTTRTTLPEPGVSRTQKKGRSQPSSV